MWTGSVTIAFVVWILNALGLLVGAMLGARLLFNPRWAAGLARLMPDEALSPETRAARGGLLFCAHAVALWFTGKWILGGETVVGAFATSAAAVVSACWGGSAIGRGYAMWREGARTALNRRNALVEFVLAAVIGAPWAVWMLGLLY